MCKISTFHQNLSTIFLKLLNIYLFSKIFQKVKIVKLRRNILQYLICNEKLEIFLTCFCNILCYVRTTMGFFSAVSMISKVHDTRIKCLREILFKNIAIIAIQHDKFILLTPMAIFFHTVG